jgi:hypothetical protein
LTTGGRTVSIHSTALSDIEKSRGQRAPKQAQAPPEPLLEILDELRQRLERLERATRPARRGFLNQKQAAEYLGRSDEWLRLEHAAKRGPKRRRIGARGWGYAIRDLDAYLEGDLESEED